MRWEVYVKRDMFWRCRDCTVRSLVRSVWLYVWYVCVHACVLACVRACVRACVCVCECVRAGAHQRGYKNA